VDVAVALGAAAVSVGAVVGVSGVLSPSHEASARDMRDSMIRQAIQRRRSIFPFAESGIIMIWLGKRSAAEDRARRPLRAPFDLGQPILLAAAADQDVADFFGRVSHLQKTEISL
jgi:hypothetical protein